MVYSVRKNCGTMLAKESPVEADIVSTIPESATPSAFGYSEATGIPYVEVRQVRDDWQAGTKNLPIKIIYRVAKAPNPEPDSFHYHAADESVTLTLNTC